MNARIATYLLIILASALVFSSCMNRPREVLGRRAMERLMFDVLVAEAEMTNEFNYFHRPEAQEAYIREVFRRHRVTPQQWYASLDWYADRINIFLQINDSVLARLGRERAIIDARIARYEEWEQMISATFDDNYIPRHYAFWTPSQRSGFSFELDSIELAERLPYDEFYFQFSVIGIPPIEVPDFRAVLRLEYADTTLFLVENIRENATFRMPIQRYIERDSLLFAIDSIQFQTLSLLSGFVRLPDMRQEFRNIQLFDIALGIEYEYKDEYLYDDEYEYVIRRSESWFKRWWQRMFGNRQRHAEDYENQPNEFIPVW